MTANAVPKDCILANHSAMNAAMSKTPRKKDKESRTLPKAPTGIQGLDEITGGGFPRGRPTLVCGSAGAGKTLLAMEFLVRGATEYNEPEIPWPGESCPRRR